MTDLERTIRVGSLLSVFVFEAHGRERLNVVIDAFLYTRVNLGQRMFKQINDHKSWFHSSSCIQSALERIQRNRIHEYLSPHKAGQTE